MDDQENEEYPMANLSESDNDCEAEDFLKTNLDEEYGEAEQYFSDDESLSGPSRFKVAAKRFTTNIKVTVEQSKQGGNVYIKKCCERCCFEYLTTISSEVKASLKNKFEKSKIIDKKNILLGHLQNTSDVHIENFDDDSDFYYFEQNKICIKAYSELTGVSSFVLQSVRNDFKKGRTASYEHGNRGKGRQTLAGSNFIAWMLDFSKKYAQDSPDENLVVLPKIFIVTELFQIYQEEVKGKLVSKNGFFKLFKRHFGPNRENKEFPRIRISKYSSHARCDECVKLQEARKMVRCAADLEIVRKRTEAHRQEYAGARIEIDRLILLCSSFPKDYLGNPLIYDCIIHLYKCMSQYTIQLSKYKSV